MKPCCTFLNNPELIKQLKETEGKARWRETYMYVTHAVNWQHVDCVGELLNLNGDFNFLSGAMGKAMATAAVKCEYAIDKLVPLLIHFLRYGIDVTDFNMCKPCKIVCNSQYNPPRIELPISPLLKIMNLPSPVTSAILLQKPYAGMSPETSSQLHRQVVCKAVDAANEELVSRLLEAGTNKQMLLTEIYSQIATNRKFQVAKAQKLKETVAKKKLLPLTSMSRLKLWSLMSHLKDILKLELPHSELPISIAGFLLFDDHKDYPVTRKLKAEK